MDKEILTEKAFKYFKKMKEDIENSCYKPNENVKKEIIIQTILNSKMDYIPVNQSQTCLDFFVLNKQEILYILSDKNWNYQFATMSGWGFNTPFLIIDSKSLYLELFLSKDELMDCGKEEFIKIGYTEF